MSHLRLFGACLMSAALLACVQQHAKQGHTAHGEIGNYANQTGRPSSAYIDREPTLYSNLGNLHYAISSNSKLVQNYFDQGLRLTYAFNHAEARRAFRMAQKLDPNCAMC